MAEEVPSLGELLRDAPKNWGRWGPDDEVGALNYLTNSEVLRGTASVRSGKVFTLQTPMADPNGDPVPEGREAARRYMVSDKSHWLAGKGAEVPGGAQWADDCMIMYLQGSTQYDALGHVWFDDQLYNGYDAMTTIGGLAKASVFPLSTRGIAGRGLLLDLARHHDKLVLDSGETFGLQDLLSCADAQGSPIEPRDILLIRTGQMGAIFGPQRRYYLDEYTDPGLVYSPELVAWFQKMEIPNLVTDSTANEVYVDPNYGTTITLHGALMRNLGVVFAEMAWLDELATDCANDQQYSFLYTAGPLKVIAAAGAPVNPLVIK